MLNIEVVSKKITLQRKLKGMTQNELADKLFVTRQAVSKWEMGNSLPSLEVLILLTKLFDVTIDYLLDGSDIKENDYQQMFMQYPRESVIYQFLNSKDKNQNIKNIFYLLSINERKQIIDQLISRQINLDINLLWPHLSLEERKYLLANLLSKKLDIRLDGLFDLMSNEEKVMMNKHKVFVKKINK